MVIDCLGQLCPVPVIELAKALPTVAIGEVIELLSDDAAAAVDIPAWCRMRGQSFEGADGPSYKVRRVS
jgi:tRNA 2-thiouridine synthesizing protein A